MPQRIIPWTYWGCKPLFRGFSKKSGKKIYYSELAEILTFSLPSCISMSFDILSNHIQLTRRSSQIRTFGVSFLTSLEQNCWTGNFLLSCIILDNISSICFFCWPSEKTVNSKMVDITTSCTWVRDVLAKKETIRETRNTSSWKSRAIRVIYGTGTMQNLFVSVLRSSAYKTCA